jgi:DoxX-like family
MNGTNKQKVVYWVVTTLFLLPMAGSGVPELLFGQPASTVAALVHLGYPLYLMRILGLAKVLGAVAIMSGRSRTLTEWAYAGYTFDLLGAIASHLIVGVGAFAAVPATVMALVLTSYVQWSRVAGTSSKAVRGNSARTA